MISHPRVFIGSSSEGAKYAYAVQKNLEKSAECTVWDQGAFALARALFVELIEGLSRFDFAIFLLSPDDELEVRGASHVVPRDNVVFELGLFIGALGADRTFIIAPRGIENLRLPTDILGVIYATFDSKRSDQNWPAALGPACNEIKSHIAKLGSLRIKRASADDDQSIRYAAAVCFRRVDMAIEFLLVNSTRARRIFPKGRIRDGEEVRAAAMRYAYAEGGALGQPTDENHKIFRYFKEENHELQIIGAILIEVTSQVKPRARFRDPRWFDLTTAEKQFTEERDFEHVAELRNVLRWAHDEIERINKPVIQSAILPFRWVESKVEILLITSKSQRHWIIPKGNVPFGQSARASAIREALEEAGIEGATSRGPIAKSKFVRLGVEHSVETFSMEVKREHQDWPEKLFRERKWMGIERAASEVDYEHLKQTIVDFGKIVRG